MSERGRRGAVLALAITTLLVGLGGVGYRWFTASTEVSSDEAVQRFREGRPSPEGSPTPGLTPTPADLAAAATPTPGTGGGRSEVTVSAPTPTPVPTPAPPPTGPGGFVLLPPEEGVYEWETDGWEQAGPSPRRDLPERSRRIITREGERTWMNDHIYSDQHEEWFPLTVSEQGVSAASYRIRVAFGPFTQDQQLDFSPPMRFSVFPLEVGQQWQGSWEDAEDNTRGTYVGQTFERTHLDIGGEQVEVWGIEVDMEMEGDTSGRVLTRIWVSPEHRMTVKEYYEQEVESGPGTYEGEWTITLLSTTPQQ